ncbi:MAG: cation diffusion facilitator family transporter [Longimicrobiales bacterium]|nr:cation diffusion facilitator family transporter [Longimicrobiales bacterium]
MTDSDAHGSHGSADHAGHGHGPHRHEGLGGGMVERGGETGRLKIVLILTGIFMVVEVVGGVVSGSLALLADAGHMFTDVGAVGLSLVAMRWASRPPSPEKTYGYVRLEILAALVNGAGLLVLAGVICWEAYKRLMTPQSVDGPVMLAVAGAGLLVNVAGAFLLHDHAHENLNVRGAYLHVLGDLLGSVGAIAAAVVILTTGWMPADPIISVVIALLILVSAWRLVREATDVLLEAAPAHIDVEEVLADLSAIPDLHDVHDLHVWTLTSGFVALSGHGVIDDPQHQAHVLDEIREVLEEHGIEHMTFQLEPRRLYQLSEADNAVREGDDSGV